MCYSVLIETFLLINDTCYNINIMKNLSTLLFLLFSMSFQAQMKLDSTMTPEENFEFNCSSMLQYGTYIPSNLEECMIVLMHYGDKKLCEFQALTEEEAEKIGFDEYEIRMRTNWDLKASSVLAQYFYQKGIYSHETMTSIILVTFHRYLNKHKFEDIAVIQLMKKKYRKVEKDAYGSLIEAGKSRYRKHKKTKRRAKKERRKALKQEDENSLLNEIK
ncbi:MAG: hypothetical protein ACI9N1_001709 [Flavobacteriales bacterium]|jgi:hypothetical protein